MAGEVQDPGANLLVNGSNLDRLRNLVRDYIDKVIRELGCVVSIKIQSLKLTKVPLHLFMECEPSIIAHVRVELAAL